MKATIFPYLLFSNASGALLPILIDSSRAQDIILVLCALDYFLFSE